VTKPLSPEELKNLDLLVKKAIGFDEERNDSLHIVNASFQAADMGDPASETSFLERPWLWEILKQLGGLVLVVLLVFGVLRPVMRGLAEKGGKKSPEQAVLADASSPGGLPAPDELPPDRLSVSSEGAGPLGQLAAPQDYAPKLSKAQSVVNEDPKLAANLVREWLTE
jgi:flagellar M-ring protein FliF